MELIALAIPIVLVIQFVNVSGIKMIKVVLIGVRRSGLNWLYNMLEDLYKHDKKDIIIERRKTPEEVAVLYPDYKIIGLVRNPRDRIVSIAFRERYRENDIEVPEIANASCDFKAIDLAVNNQTIQNGNDYQISIMRVGESTRAQPLPNDYVWTSYRWLVKNTKLQIKRIANFLDAVKPDSNVEYAVYINSFEYKTGGRKHEDPTQSLRVKGLHNWIEWLTNRPNSQHLLDTQQIHNQYRTLVNDEENN